jgi:AMP deaminase
VCSRNLKTASAVLSCCVLAFDSYACRYQLAEYRISIYGKDPGEWDNLAKWVVNHRLLSPNVRWLIQIPRIFSTFSRAGSLQNFEQMLSNIFRPLFETTIDPSSHPFLHKFLQHVVGFDSVDDESLPEWKLHNTPKSSIPKPLFFDSGHTVIPYNYYLYYMWANISVLNRLRMSVPRRGYREFSFRPHAGEAGLVDHLAGAFLLSDGLSHGIVAKSSPSMQMLLYLSQIGVAMSPMSNNSLFVHYNDNPFDTFFRRGLNLSLSTDDPLQFHYTTQPLIEEYGVASTVWHYSSADMCEIARNSVLQSGFEDGLKSHWLGPRFGHGACGNDMNKSNVPDERLRFRERNLKEERDFFSRCKKMHDDAKMARRAALPQVPVPQTPQVRSAGSPVESASALQSFASLTRPKAASHHASGKMSPSLTCSSPKKSYCPSSPFCSPITFVFSFFPVFSIVSHWFSEARPPSQLLVILPRFPPSVPASFTAPYSTIIVARS